jgi:glycosidase
MQWGNDTSNAGFTRGTPWLSVNPNTDDINAWEQGQNDSSTLSVFKQLTTLRVNEASLQYGNTHFVNSTQTSVLAFVREWEGFDRILTVLNLGTMHAHGIDLTSISSSISVPTHASVVIKTADDVMVSVGSDVDLRSFMLDPGQGFIARWAYERPT